MAMRIEVAHNHILLSTVGCMLLVLSSSSTSTACTTIDGCLLPETATSAVTCLDSLCKYCPVDRVGNIRVADVVNAAGDVSCFQGCSAPGSVGDSECATIYGNSSYYCFAPFPGGYETRTIQYKLGSGIENEFGGTCASCVTPGYTINSAATSCEPASAPPAPAPSPPDTSGVQSCVTLADCDTPVNSTAAVTCLNSVCMVCEGDSAGSTRVADLVSEDGALQCYQGCSGPGPTGDAQCSRMISVENLFCFAPFPGGYSTPSIESKLGNGETKTFGGTCATCSAGYTINPDFTGCKASAATPNSAPAPAADKLQNCAKYTDCTPPAVATSSVSCFQTTCQTCEPNGQWTKASFIDANTTLSKCFEVCFKPGEEDNCPSKTKVPNTFCWAPSAGGHTEVEVPYRLGDGTPGFAKGFCKACDDGKKIKGDGTACVDPAEVSTVPPAPGSTPPSNDGKTDTGKGDAVNKIALALGLSIAGAILAGIIGMGFYFLQVAHLYRLTRNKYPLADMMRKDLKLKTVSNFDSNPGLQFRASVDRLAEALDSHGVLRPVSLLGTSVSSLALAVTSVLRVRYVSDQRENEAGFLVLFAKDCSEEEALSALVSDVEAVIAGNPGWAASLMVPPPNQMPGGQWVPPLKSGGV